MTQLLLVAFLFGFGLITAGCTVPTTYTKSITVRKDAAGNIIESQETETVVQPGGQGYPVRFDYLTGVRPPAQNSVEEEPDMRSGYEFRKRNVN
ncbi:hypothetical protein W02_08730 [Nitrospira sp. KM1]|uniref:hypothetical protein n=1 Tax=Nitrospira sp. KM1 TaxID=1936990 RepID=UPI0013A793D4|nr:hypothetical protein [Nitrospira sp. KM1]BCA53733.1 hypothetical protein W02_08730 [Nitrospira sp. KM1]